MILLSSVLRPCRFPYVQRLAALGVTAAFLTFVTDALAQERYRTPDKAVAALVDAMRSEALQRVMRVLGPGSDEIVSSGDPVDDAATRKRLLELGSVLPEGPARSPEALAELVKSEVARWTPILQAAGARGTQ